MKIESKYDLGNLKDEKMILLGARDSGKDNIIFQLNKCCLEYEKENKQLKEELGKQERESKIFRTLYNKALSFIIRLSMEYSFSKEELDEFCELQNYKTGE